MNAPEPYETKVRVEFCFPGQQHEYLSQQAARRQRVLRRVLEEQERAYVFERRWPHDQCPPCRWQEKDSEKQRISSDTHFLHILNDSRWSDWRSRPGRGPWSFDSKDEFYEALEMITCCSELKHLKGSTIRTFERALELALAILEEAIAQGYHDRACFLDYVQQVE